MKWNKLIFALSGLFIFLSCFKVFSAEFQEPVLTVSILGIFKPKEVIISSGNEILSLHSKEIKEPFFKNSHEGFTVEIPGKIKRSYAGRIEFRMQNGVFLLLNHVKLSDYLASVVSSEMGAFSLEALKAQAVLARTVAYHAFFSRRDQDYHLSDLTDSQVYKGKDLIRLKAEQAVKDTRDEILSFEGRIVPVFYCSTCGGKTSTPEKVWGGLSVGIVSVRCEYGQEILCRHSSHSFWQWRSSLKDIGRIVDIKNLNQIQILEKDDSGRAVWILFSNEQGNQKKMRGEDFHILIGRFYKNWGLLKSSLFELRMEEDEVLFLGQGLGHGVGLCQFGSGRMAQLGFSYLKILEWYFPLLKITRIQDSKMEE